MHEARIARDALDILTETVKSDASLNGRPVKSITFSLSTPHTVVPDSFEFYFSELVRGTVFENAELTFLDIVNPNERGFFITSIEVED